MPGCSLRYCRNSTKKFAKADGITFHRFPRQRPKQMRAWTKFVQINRSEPNWLPNCYSHICSVHFREEDKYITKSGRFFLKDSAVPYADKRSPLCRDAPLRRLVPHFIKGRRVRRTSAGEFGILYRSAVVKRCEGLNI
ncbi:jg7981 [Pararge aegeria aegeria]|uniref:Jg7981 protein n=1 Tax=Pararge aegeria aegeria TaxID=348720 RepID=A0A8S4QP28_9NEOP|nr:jg7981 [Pararge aegeria aegeria]